MSSSKCSTYDPISKIWRGPSRPSIYNAEVGFGYIILNVLKQNPDRVMQVCDDSGAEMTCGEMHSRTAKISTYLSSKTELKQGDVVGIIARNSENLAPLAYACFTLGLPINPLAPVVGEREISEMYSKTRPKAIFCDFDLVETVVKALKKIELENCKIFTFIGKIEGLEFVNDILRDFEGNVDDFEPPCLPNISTTPLIILCSSGTSGSMKGISRCHKSYISLFSRTVTEPFGNNSVCFFPSTLHWLTGVHVLIASVLFQFKRIITTKSMSPELFMDILKRQKVTQVFMAPFVCKNLPKINPKIVLKDAKSLIIGGSSVIELNFEKLQEIFPNAVIRVGYATSESDLLTISKKFNGTACSGELLPNIQLKIIDDSGALLGPNERGQICFKTPVMFDGYYGEPEATKSAFDPDGWCYTGDIGYFDDEGHLFVIDRIKHMLKYDGFIVAPLDIESIINEIEGVLNCCVVGVYRDGNDIIHAFVIKDEKKVDLSEKFIENYVNERVIDVKKIRGGVHFVKEFPMTATEKVKNRELREVAEKIHSE